MPSIELLPNKEYVLSCWVARSKQVSHTYQGNSETNLSMQILYPEGDEEVGAENESWWSNLMEPSGKIIEGWQRVE